MSRAFMFTMDAVLALIPVFIILASVSAISSGQILFLHTSILGEKRIAQDALAVMDFSGAMGSANQTLLNQTLEKLIPGHLSYNYTVENLNGTQKFSIARGNISNATDIVAARRIGAITSEYRVAVASTVLAPTVRDVKDDKAIALNAVLYALLGVKQIDADDDFDDWEDVGNVTISISELLAVSPATIGNLVNKLIANANAQDSANAEDALTDFKSALTASQQGLTYNTGDFLVYTASDVAMNISASDALLAAVQSANYRRGSLNPSYTSLTTILGEDEDYGINFTLDIQTPTQIAVRTVGDIFYATQARVNLYVYETQGGSVKDNATINYNITSRPSFKIDKIEQKGAAIEVTVKSISYDTSGTGWINASAITYGTGGSAENATFKQQDKNKKINFNWQPKQEKLDVFKKNSGIIENNYNYAEGIARKGDLDKILQILSFQGNVDKKEGYVTVSDVEFAREEDLITLKIWR